jgi:hypothetical protein
MILTYATDVHCVWQSARMLFLKWIGAKLSWSAHRPAWNAALAKRIAS